MNPLEFDKYMPLWFWTDGVKAEFKRTEQLQFSDCYELYGMKRTGCCGCPYKVFDCRRTIKGGSKMTITTTIPATRGGMLEYNHIIDKLIENGFTITSRRRKSGYLSRKIHALISPYSGRYGDGFTIEKPAFDNTGMHWIQYAIKPETADK